MTTEPTFEQEWKSFLDSDQPPRVSTVVCACMATMAAVETGWQCPDCGQVVVLVRGVPVQPEAAE